MPTKNPNGKGRVEAVADPKVFRPRQHISERAKIKEYPATRSMWAREVDGIVRFLRTLPDWERAYGLVWTTKMGEYYTERLKYLRHKGPPKASVPVRNRVIPR